MVKTREFILYLNYKFNGNWERIKKFLEDKEEFDKEEMENYIENQGKNEDYFSIIDYDYPEIFKCLKKPPFIVFKKDLVKEIEKAEEEMAQDFKKRIYEN